MQTRTVWHMQLDHQRNRVLRINLLISIMVGGSRKALPSFTFGPRYHLLRPALGFGGDSGQLRIPGRLGGFVVLKNYHEQHLLCTCLQLGPLKPEELWAGGPAPDQLLATASRPSGADRQFHPVSLLASAAWT